MLHPHNTIILCSVYAKKTFSAQSAYALNRKGHISCPNRNKYSMSLPQKSPAQKGLDEAKNSETNISRSGTINCFEFNDRTCETFAHMFHEGEMLLFCLQS
jgi:hypothetical protein